MYSDLCLSPGFSAALCEINDGMMDVCSLAKLRPCFRTGDRRRQRDRDASNLWLFMIAVAVMQHDMDVPRYHAMFWYFIKQSIRQSKTNYLHSPVRSDDGTAKRKASVQVVFLKPCDLLPFTFTIWGDVLPPGPALRPLGLVDPNRPMRNPILTERLLKALRDFNKP